MDTKLNHNQSVATTGGLLVRTELKAGGKIPQHNEALAPVRAAGPIVGTSSSGDADRRPQRAAGTSVRRRAGDAN